MIEYLLVQKGVMDGKGAGDIYLFRGIDKE